MRRRIRAIIEMLSLAACAIIVGFTLLAHVIDARESQKSIGKDRNVSLLASGWDARLWLLNDNGPWHGPTTDASTVSEFNWPLITYQYIVWPNGEVAFSLTISLMIPLLLFGTLFLVLFLRRVRRVDRGFSVDPHNATPDRCPECGNLNNAQR